MKKLLLAAAMIGAWSAQGQESRVRELERTLPGLEASERIATLAALTDLLRGDDAQRAIAYGSEALALLEVDPDPAEEAALLAEMAWAHMVLGAYPTAIETAEKARDRAVAHGLRSSEARSLNNLGVIARRQGNPTRAIELFSEALELYRQEEDERAVAMSLNNLGFTASMDLTDYDLGLQYHLEALTMREALGDRRGVAQTYNNIGNIYVRLGDYDEAIASFEDALAIRRELGIKHRVASTLNNLGVAHQRKGQLEVARDYQLQSLELRREIGDMPMLAHSLRDTGAVCLALGRPDEARPHLEEGLAIAEALGDAAVEASTRLQLSALERQLGAPDRALAYAEESLRLADQVGSDDLRMRSHEELATVHEAAGRPGPALDAFRRFKAVSDRIFDETKTRRLENLELQYETARQERAIERLEKEKALRLLALEQQRLRWKVTAAVLGMVGVLGFLVYRRRVEMANLAEDLSLTDALTGLRNRRFVHQTLETDVAVAVRRHLEANGRSEDPAQADLVFLLLDLDRFKEVNDTYGHAAGDAVLREVGERLRRISRSTDTVVRWGGEEFLLVYRFVDRQEAASLAERVRGEIGEEPFAIDTDRSMGRTCSVGAAAFPFRPQRPEALSWLDVIEVADQALFAAKRAGRNAWAVVRAVEKGPGAAEAVVERVDVMEQVRLGAWQIETSTAPDFGARSDGG